MGFSKDIATKYLDRYMFSHVKKKTDRSKKIQTVLNRMSAVSVTKVHGRMIDGNTAKNELELNVRLLGKEDPLWKLLWQYYLRADVAMNNIGAAKLVETKAEMLFKVPTREA
jgi:hypothetical protein